MLQDGNPEQVPARLRQTAAIAALLTIVSLPMLIPSPSNNVSTLFFDKGPLLLPLFATLLYFIPLGEDVLLKPAFLETQLPRYLGLVSGHLFLLHWPVRLLVARVTTGTASVFFTVVLQLIVAVAAYEAQKTLMGPTRSKKTTGDPEQIEDPKNSVGGTILN